MQLCESIRFESEKKIKCFLMRLTLRPEHRNDPLVLQNDFWTIRGIPHSRMRTLS